MKKFYTLFIVLFGSILFGQEYRPMLSENNLWRVSFGTSIGGGDGYHSTDVDHKLTSETIIFNDKEYIREQTRARAEIGTSGGYGEWSDWSNGNVYFHENIEEKKVYIYYEVLNEEYLLYNFNLEVGDIIPLTGFRDWDAFYEQMNIKIISIGYENVFGLENVKTFYTDGISTHHSNIKIYEGIGASTGINTIVDVTDMISTLYDFANTLGLSEHSKIETRIYPNPFSDKIQIQNSVEIKELQLFDLQGKLISTNKNLDELNSKLSSLNNAVYFLKIQFKNNKSETIKLIKNK